MSAPLFFIGLHFPHHAAHFDRSCISINRLRTRKKPIPCASVLIDSGAFTEIAAHGRYRHDPKEYADALRRLAGVVNIEAAVSQDFMCESFMLSKTGLSIPDHQRLTIDRYDALAAEGLSFPIMPVLQGFEPSDYAAHAAAYGDRLKPGMWVGVGSVCKRNGRPEAILAVLIAILAVRPDLRLHGFGVKQTSLLHAGVRSILHSADSMAWSFSARKQGRDGNSLVEAMAFHDRIVHVASAPPTPWQPSFNF